MSVSIDPISQAECDRDLLSPIPALVFRQHLLPWLDSKDCRNLRLVNKQFSELYRSTTTSLNIRICLEALRGLTPEGDSISQSEGAPTSGLQRQYPCANAINIYCDARPLTPLPNSSSVAQLVRLLAGCCSSQAQLTLLNAHCHAALGGGILAKALSASRSCTTSTECGHDGGTATASAGRPKQGSDAQRAHSDCDCNSYSDGSERGEVAAEDAAGAAAVVARALAAAFPALTKLCFKGGASQRPDADRWRMDRCGAPDGGGKRAATAAVTGTAAAAATAATSGRAVLALQPLLRHLFAALREHPHPADDGKVSGSSSGSSVNSVGEDSGGRGCSDCASSGVQSLCVDYSSPSADPFEGEILEPQFPALPLLLLELQGASGGGGGGGGFVSAAAQHPILKQPAAQRPAPAAAATAPLLWLTSLELRGVAVQPGLLAGLRELAALTRLVLSVSCARPYEPLVTSLPYLRRLAHLHLFLHVPPTAAGRQLGALAAAAAAGRVSGGAAEDVGTPDCTAVQLTAAVSLCRGLVSLSLPGEDVDGRMMAAVLQALPGLTSLSARQLNAWELELPHTGLRALTLTMTWPSYLAALLPSLPRLHTLTADMYVHASDDGAGGGGGRGGSTAGARRRGRGGDVGGGGGVEQLYDEIQSVVSGLRGVRHVELQLSTMRAERWEWGRIARLLRRLRGLRGLALRLPQPDSGPQLRAQHLAALCSHVTCLRRLALLVAHPSCAKLNAKALQALCHLPYIELVQLHLGGAWEGRRLPQEDVEEYGNGVDRYDNVSCAGGGGGSSGDPRSRSPHGSADAAAPRHNTRQAVRSGRYNKYGKYDGSSRYPLSSARSAPAAPLAAATAGLTGPGGRTGADGSGRSTAVHMAPPPPLLPPDGSAARAVLEAARALRSRRQCGAGSSMPATASDDDGDGDSSASTPPADDPTGSDREEGREDAAPRPGGNKDREGDLSRVGGSSGDAAANGELGYAPSGRSNSGGWRGVVAARLPPPSQPVELQVDFLTAREAARVNAVLHWEGRPVRVRAGLQPGWVWCELMPPGC